MFILIGQTCFANDLIVQIQESEVMKKPQGNLRVNLVSNAQQKIIILSLQASSDINKCFDLQKFSLTPAESKKLPDIELNKCLGLSSEMGLIAIANENLLIDKNKIVKKTLELDITYFKNGLEFIRKRKLYLLFVKNGSNTY